MLNLCVVMVAAAAVVGVGDVIFLCYLNNKCSISSRSNISRSRRSNNHGSSSNSISSSRVSGNEKVTSYSFAIIIVVDVVSVSVAVATLSRNRSCGIGEAAYSWSIREQKLTFLRTANDICFSCY